MTTDINALVVRTDGHVLLIFTQTDSFLGLTQS